MKLSAQMLIALDAVAGAGSPVTADEYEKKQITLVSDEKDVLFSIIRPQTVYRGNVKDGGSRTEQEAILYIGSKEKGIIRPHLVFPKLAKDELRLYISEKAFAPSKDAFWYVFKRQKDDRLCLGWADPTDFKALHNGASVSGPALLPPNAAEDDDSSNPTDLAARIKRSILARRGQAQFRKRVRARFDDTCCVTGSKLLDVLEAAHIELAPGKDNHNSCNGLLLRTDIHTLFDLGLIAIHPETLELYLSANLISTEYYYLSGQRLKISESVSKTINRSGLRQRWESLIWTGEISVQSERKL
jgi:HNH endonuclease